MSVAVSSANCNLNSQATIRMNTAVLGFAIARIDAEMLAVHHEKLVAHQQHDEEFRPNIAEMCC